MKKPVLLLVTLVALLSLGVELAVATPEGVTTLDTIIIDTDGDGLLEEVSPGEPYTVREDLSVIAQEGRERRRESLLLFAHLTDLHVVDEESPLRVEYLDVCGPPFTSALRPQESLSTHVLNSMVRQLNSLSGSPATGAPLALIMQTGDATDSCQYDELRWFINVLDGGTVNPNSGASSYDGVQTESPDPDYPDLLEEANRPFTAVGLKMAWYSVFGNHDNLVQGTLRSRQAWERVATGRLKVFNLGFIEEICDSPELLADPRLLQQMRVQTDREVRSVPPDGDRRLVSHREFVEEHFVTRGSPIGHGFTEENAARNSGYYSFDPTPDLHFIVLDTLNEGGGPNGSIDTEQFAWLEEQLIANSSWYYDDEGNPISTPNEDRLMVIFSHHTLEALNSPNPGPTPGGSSVLGPEFEALLHRFPNVIAHLAGHTHRNKVWPRPDLAGRTGGYWEINTASLSDWPQQSRLVEIVDNKDGSLSIFCTMVDHSSPADPAQAIDPTPEDGVNEGRLASISRQLSYLDPQAGDNGARGTLLDRNVELLIADSRENRGKS